jgi:hypothetical protein
MTDIIDIKYGWYSAIADAKFGHAVYLNESGEEVNVTAVSLDKDTTQYKWEDKIYIGVVTKWIKNDHTMVSRSMGDLWFWQ